MTVSQTHRASIHWSRDQQRLGLPTTTLMTDPAWLAAETPRENEGWSLVCEFERPPAEQGSPSQALVHYLVPAAPHSQLVLGARLQLFERATGQTAEVEILS